MNNKKRIGEDMGGKDFNTELECIKKIVQNYLLTCCKIRGKLLDDLDALKPFFILNQKGQKSLKREQAEISLYIRQCKLYNEEYIVDVYKLKVHFLEVEIVEDLCRVSAWANEVKKYRVCDQWTKIKEVPHILFLQKVKGKWGIIEHLHEHPFIKGVASYNKEVEDQKEYFDLVATYKQDFKAFRQFRGDTRWSLIKKKIVRDILEEILEIKNQPFGEVENQLIKNYLSKYIKLRNVELKVSPERRAEIGDLIKYIGSEGEEKEFIITGYVMKSPSSQYIKSYLVTYEDPISIQVPLDTLPHPYICLRVGGI